MNRGGTDSFAKPGSAGICIRREQESFQRAGLKSQLRSQFHGSVPVRSANGAGDVAEANSITGVSVWLIEVRSIRYAECLRANFQTNSLSYRESLKHCGV